jgi:ketosteroid isomerase-like protein
MDANQVGKKLVDLCRTGKNMDAIDSLYSPNIVSIEAMGDDKTPAETKGIDKIKQKNKHWYETNEVHSARVEGPFPNKDRFAVKYHYETTPKAGPMQGKRMTLDEVAVYTVKDGKIVREEFFYDMG